MANFEKNFQTDWQILKKNVKLSNFKNIKIQFNFVKKRQILKKGCQILKKFSYFSKIEISKK